MEPTRYRLHGRMSVGSIVGDFVSVVSVAMQGYATQTHINSFKITHLKSKYDLRFGFYSQWNALWDRTLIMEKYSHLYWFWSYFSFHSKRDHPDCQCRDTSHSWIRDLFIDNTIATIVKHLVVMQMHLIGIANAQQVVIFYYNPYSGL